MTEKQVEIALQLRWYASVSVSKTHWATAEWRLTQNSKGEWVARSGGIAHSSIPVKMWGQMGCSARKINETTVIDWIKQAQKGNGYMVSEHGITIVIKPFSYFGWRSME
jgi:hypothetical protein